MTQSAEIKSFVSQIVEDAFPEEREVFEEFADSYMDKFAADENIRDLKPNGAYAEFDSKVFETVASSLSTLVGTIITILEFRRKSKSKNFDLLTSKWYFELIANGIPEDKAQAITDKYGEDLKKYVL
jgi:hypothetical protein